MAFVPSHIVKKTALSTTLIANSFLSAASAGENRIDLIRPDAPALADFGAHKIGVTSRAFLHKDQLDIVSSDADTLVRYDRPLPVEIWYPAADNTTPGGTYEVTLRDPNRTATLHGQAARDAPPKTGTQFPLIVLSHGYPGNRFLMSHLGENLASKGYVVASIDHTDSTYADQNVFGATLLNRPIDQRFVIDSMTALDGPIGAIINTDSIGLIGYSMGGYGVLISGGAGLADGIEDLPFAPPQGTLRHNVSGTDTHESLVDSRVKALVSIGPWGRNHGFWDDAGLAGLRKPTLLIAGEVDDVSDYDAMREIFTHSTGATRHLLTFENANHNAAAPIPAPLEAWKFSESLGYAPFDHYADPVWDTTRMNNIAQHFTTAFMDLHLKSDHDKSGYLDLIPNPKNSLHALDDNGKPTAEHTYWKGFPARTAVGLTFETLEKDH
ncbi:alpha/beta hydrolase family protein [Shimia sp.]|uniref:alpha/beta hydrolase family protein n=1 Tax=Shimia sp. TaxID=1954381 RepID=UPI003BACD7D8